MMMDEQLKRFMTNILNITPQYTDILGNGVPGMAGRSASTSGAANSGVDVTDQLHRKAIGFARDYGNAKVSTGELQEAAGEVEGLLMVAVTLGVLAEKMSQERVNDLHRLLENR